MKETIYLAGGCLWGVQAFFKLIPGVIDTEAGRANGKSQTLDGVYDGYTECVKITFNTEVVTVKVLMGHLFEIIDPYSLNKQGEDVGLKYRTGVYSEQSHHLNEAQNFIVKRSDCKRIAVEVLPLTNYVKSSEVHQDRLDKFPNDYCHIPIDLMKKYKRNVKS